MNAKKKIKWTKKRLNHIADKAIEKFIRYDMNNYVAYYNLHNPDIRVCEEEPEEREASWQEARKEILKRLNAYKTIKGD